MKSALIGLVVVSFAVQGAAQTGSRTADSAGRNAGVVSTAKDGKGSQWKSDREWSARLRRFRSWLGGKARRDAAEEGLNSITDPSAVRSIWTVFVTRRAADQRVAVRLLGQVESRPSSRGLTLLAVSGVSADVRRAAIETLRWREPLDFADLLIGQLRDPVHFRVQPVGGPGRPGSITIRGAAFDLERIFAPPAPPDLPLSPQEAMAAASGADSILVFHTDTTGLPFVWVDKQGNKFPSHAVIPPHVPVYINPGAIWRESLKTADSAQRQLDGDIATIERRNARQRAENTRIAQVLNEVTQQSLPATRDAWATWWFRRLGRTRPTPRVTPRPTLTEQVPLDYLPQIVSGLGFDPVAGYFALASAGR